MLRRDIPEVLAIDADVFPCPRGEDDFVCALRQRNCIGWVYTINEIVAGYAVYELHKHRLHLLTLAVRRDQWRRGIGSAIVKRLKDKLSPQRRKALICDVADYNLPAHLFLRSCGFVCEGVHTAAWAEEDEDVDAYRFAYRVGATAEIARADW